MKIELEVPEMLVPMFYEILNTDVPEDDDGHVCINIMRHTGAETGEQVEAELLVGEFLDMLSKASDRAMVARTLVGKGKRSR